MNEWNADFADLIAVGDSANDMELLEAAGMGIAMGNASDEIKSIVNYITTDIGLDGIYHAFKYLDMI